jgi:hypothetical protein
MLAGAVVEVVQVVEVKVEVEVEAERRWAVHGNSDGW